MSTSSDSSADERPADERAAGGDQVLPYAKQDRRANAPSVYVARRILLYIAMAALFFIGYQSFDGADTDSYCVQCGVLRHTSEARCFGVTIPLQSMTTPTTLSQWIEKQSGRACTHDRFNLCENGWHYGVCHHGNPVAIVSQFAQLAGLREFLDQQLAADPAFMTRLLAALSNQSAADSDEFRQLFIAATEHAISLAAPK